MEKQAQNEFVSRTSRISLTSRLFFISILLSYNQTFSQSTHAPNLFIELAGNGGIASLNYDWRFSNRNNGLGARVGLGVVGVEGGFFGKPTLSIPLAVNCLAGPGPHYVEIGAGITLGANEYGHRDYEERRPLFLVPSFGYRYQPSAKGLTVRAFGAAFYLLSVRYTAGLSIGIRL